MGNSIILCTGGARSGKSEFAESLAKSFHKSLAYIATGQVFDQEMAARVKAHQARRGAEWSNFEIPTNLSKAWPEVAKQAEVVLIDCLTMFTTNYLLQEQMEAGSDALNPEDTQMEQGDVERIESLALSDLEGLLHQIETSSSPKTVIFVTNEVGLGIIPDNPLARTFRDVVGKVNRLVASRADKVYLTMCGITIEMKSQEVHIDG